MRTGAGQDVVAGAARGALAVIADRGRANGTAGLAPPHSRPAGCDGLPGYLPIAEHGVIGDLHSVALVGTSGAIDWFCCPRFDSPSVFGAILDRRRGGHFTIAPSGDPGRTRQLYLPDTNVLI